MNATLAMALIAVSLTALGLAFFLWTQATGDPDESREGENQREESFEPSRTERPEEEPDG